MTRLYTLTEAGRRAFEAQSSKVPLDSRRVLGLIKKDTDPQDLCARLGWSAATVNEILQELERDRLVRSIGASATPDAPDLDFTDTLRVADIQAALRAREKK